MALSVTDRNEMSTTVLRLQSEVTSQQVKNLTRRRDGLRLTQQVVLIKLVDLPTPSGREFVRLINQARCFFAGQADWTIQDDYQMRVLSCRLHIDPYVARLRGLIQKIRQTSMTMQIKTDQWRQIQKRLDQDLDVFDSCAIFLQ